MIVLDRVLLYIQRNNHVKVALENVTIISLILGQITSLPIALFGTAVMFFITKIRDAKMSFDGLFKDAVVWMLFAIISHLTPVENFVIAATLLIVGKFIFDKFMAIALGGSFEDIAIDFINLFYHLAFIKIFSILFLL